MNCYKLITYAEGENYETREQFINESQFRQFQKAIADGVEFLVLEDRIIRLSTIKEVTLANSEVAEFQRQGIKIDGILEPAKMPLIKGDSMKKTGDYLKDNHFSFYKKMDWKHEENCICKKQVV